MTLRLRFPSNHPPFLFVVLFEFRYIRFHVLINVSRKWRHYSVPLVFFLVQFHHIRDFTFWSTLPQNGGITYRNVELWVRHGRSSWTQIVHIGVIGTVVLVRRRIAVRRRHLSLRRPRRWAATTSTTSCTRTHTHTQARVTASVQAAVNWGGTPDGGVAGVVERDRWSTAEQRFDVATGRGVAVVSSGNDGRWWRTGRRTGVCIVVVIVAGWRWFAADSHCTGRLALAAGRTRRTPSAAGLLTSVLLLVLLLLLVLFLLLTTFRTAVLEPNLQMQRVLFLFNSKSGLINTYMVLAAAEKLGLADRNIKCDTQSEE